MIWYIEQLTIAGQPPNSTVTLSGTYTPPDESLQPAIAITLSIQPSPEATAFEVTLYNHDPLQLRHNEPEPTEALARYKPKLAQIRNKIQKLSYLELFDLRR